MKHIMFEFITVALKNLFTKPATRNYPKVVRPPFTNQRGHIDIDLPACIFCGMCDRKCPTKAIEVIRPEKQWSIDRFKCIMCNECVNVCPKKCLHTGARYSSPEVKMYPEIFKMPEQPKETDITKQPDTEKINPAEKKNA